MIALPFIIAILLIIAALANLKWKFTEPKSKFPTICDQCAVENKSGARFCKKCGKGLFDPTLDFYSREELIRAKEFYSIEPHSKDCTLMIFAIERELARRNENH